MIDNPVVLFVLTFLVVPGVPVAFAAGYLFWSRRKNKHSLRD